MKDEGLNLEVHIKNEDKGWNLDVHIKNEGWRMKSRNHDKEFSQDWFTLNTLGKLKTNTKLTLLQGV